METIGVSAPVGDGVEEPRTIRVKNQVSPVRDVPFSRIVLYPRYPRDGILVPETGVRDGLEHIPGRRTHHAHGVDDIRRNAPPRRILRGVVFPMVMEPGRAQRYSVSKSIPRDGQGPSSEILDSLHVAEEDGVVDPGEKLSWEGVVTGLPQDGRQPAGTRRPGTGCPSAGTETGMAATMSASRRRVPGRAWVFMGSVTGPFCAHPVAGRKYKDDGMNKASHCVPVTADLRQFPSR